MMNTYLHDIQEVRQLNIRKCLLPFLLLVIALGLLSCGSQTDGKTQQLVPVVRGDLAVTVSGSGNLEAINSRKLFFGTAGKVSKIFVSEGRAIAEGESVASLVTDSLELNVNQAEVAYDRAKLAVTQADVAVKSAQLTLDQALERLTTAQIMKAEADVANEKTYLQYIRTRLAAAPPGERASWEGALLIAEDRLANAEARLNTLLARGDTPEVVLARSQLAFAQQSYDVAVKSLPLAEQSLKEAKRLLDEAVLKAPFSGIIARLNVREGDYVSPAYAVAEIIDASSMKFKIQVDEIDIVHVNPGQTANIEVDALPDHRLEGQVASIGDLPSPQAGVVVYDVWINLVMPGVKTLKVGMSASADIVTARRSGILIIPDRAIGKNDKGQYVITVRVNGINELRVITIGISNGIETEIISGLQEGDTVVVERTSQNMGGFF